MKIKAPSIEKSKEGYAICDATSLEILYHNSVFASWFHLNIPPPALNELFPTLAIETLHKRLKKRGSYSCNIDDVGTLNGREIPVEFQFHLDMIDGKEVIEIHAKNASKLKEKDALLQSHARLIETSNRELAQKTAELGEAMEQLKKSYEELEESKAKQLQNAYKAGLAEQAISVLHNIGNAITPAVVSVSSFLKDNEKTLIATYLRKLHQSLLEQHELDNLHEFLKEHPKGQKMLPFLKQVADQLDSKQSQEKELAVNVEKQLNHISEIISYQQKYAKFGGFKETFCLKEMLEDMLKIEKETLKALGIKVSQDTPNEELLVHCDKNKMMQVLLNIFTNSAESIRDRKEDEPQLEAQIDIRAFSQDGEVRLTLTDNGKGASEESIKNAFQFGFSTKERGSGFGLHDCANFIKSNGGGICLHSDGILQGASILLALPHTPNESK